MRLLDRVLDGAETVTAEPCKHKRFSTWIGTLLIRCDDCKEGLEDIIAALRQRAETAEREVDRLRMFERAWDDAESGEHGPYMCYEDYIGAIQREGEAIARAETAERERDQAIATAEVLATRLIDYDRLRDAAREVRRNYYGLTSYKGPAAYVHGMAVAMGRLVDELDERKLAEEVGE